jgi:hypothetical protein
MATEMDGNEVSADQRSKLARWPFARGPCLLQSAALALANAVAQVNSQPRLIVVVNDCIATVVTLPTLRWSSSKTSETHVSSTPGSYKAQQQRAASQFSQT